MSRATSNNAYRSTSTVAVTRNYTVNGLNQYTTAGPAIFGYDGNGNLMSDGSTSFVYDAENRLVSASGAANASLVYDPLGRLFQTSGGSAGVTQFVWDGDALIAEYGASGAMGQRYVHGTAEGVDDPARVTGRRIGECPRARRPASAERRVAAHWRDRSRQVRLGRRVAVPTTDRGFE